MSKAWAYLKHLPLQDMTARIQALVVALPTLVAGRYGHKALAVSAGTPDEEMVVAEQL